MCEASTPVMVETWHADCNVYAKSNTHSMVVNTFNSLLIADMCILLQAKPTHGDIIRFAPALTMTEDQIMECSDIISRTVTCFDDSLTDDAPKAASA